MDVKGNFFIEDRDQSGTEASSHGLTTTPPGWMKQDSQGNANWYDGWSLGPLRTATAYKSGQQYHIQFLTGSCNVFDNSNDFDARPNLPNFAIKRADGYSMIGGIVQGARTYHPSSGQWLTPDAYPGDVNRKAQPRLIAYPSVYAAHTTLRPPVPSQEARGSHVSHRFVTERSKTPGIARKRL